MKHLLPKGPFGQKFGPQNSGSFPAENGRKKLTIKQGLRRLFGSQPCWVW